MTLGSADVTFVVVYLLTLVATGLYLRQRASAGLEHYLLAGRNTPWWMLGVTGVMDFWDLAGSIVIVSFLYLLGPAGLFIEFRGGAVLLLAVVMLWTGKWRRRSGCMTGAEWMRFRFGDGPAGKLAQSARAFGGIALFIGLIAYATKALGVFLSSIVPLTPEQAAIVVVALVALYSVFSGFYGLIAIQGVQFVCVVVSAVALIALAFLATPPLPELRETAASITGNPHWGELLPGSHVSLPDAYSGYEPLLFLATIYLVRNVLFGLGAGDDPKCFAARTDTDCTKLSLLWVTLMALRWPTMMAFALLAIVLVAADRERGVDYVAAAEAVRAYTPGEDWEVAVARITAAPDTIPETLRETLEESIGPSWPRRLADITETGQVDPERLVPFVLERAVPPGLRGLVLVSLLAAATAGLSGWLNQAAGLFTNDIYLVWFRPTARVAEQIAATWIVVIVMVGIGYWLAFTSKTVNDIWSWLTMGLGSGLIFAQMLPLYWRRFNGVGFATGLVGGVAMAGLQRALAPYLTTEWEVLNEEWALFALVAVAGLLACIAGTLLSPPTNAEVLKRFYLATLPFGLWAEDRRRLTADHQSRLHAFHLRDVTGLPFALAYQVTLFLTPMLVLLGDWLPAAVCGVTAGASLAITWWLSLQKLSDEARLVAEVRAAHRLPADQSSAGRRGA